MKGHMVPSVCAVLRRSGAIGALAALLAGCVSNPGDTQNIRQRGMDPVIIRSKAESDANRAMGRQTVKLHTVQNTAYVALPDVAAATGYHGAWLKDRMTYGLGDHDVVWSFRIGESRVMKAGREIRMPAPAVRQNGALMIPATALPDLMGSETLLSAGALGISLLPRPTMGETGADGSAFPFSDAPGSNRANAPLIAFAQQFAGARYEFGAGPYASSGTFDCSSYVRHVMKRFGAELPRSSREQALSGTTVSRDELVPGDLLFFNVQGRYKSQGTPGQVGIYIGGGRMIHACPAPLDGVQISDLNQPSYMRSFLYAKRVLGKP